MLSGSFPGDLANCSVLDSSSSSLIVGFRCLLWKFSLTFDGPATVSSERMTEAEVSKHAKSSEECRPWRLRFLATGLFAQFSSQPGLGESPVAFDGGVRETEHFGSLFDGEPSKEAQFDYAAVFGVGGIQQG